MASKKQIEEIPRNTIKNTQKTSEEDKSVRKSKRKSKGKTSESHPTPKIIAFFKNDKNRKVAGLFLIFFSLMLLVSFISFFFTWKADQSIAVASEGIQPVQNSMGFIGAKLAHFFIYRWFGIASFLFVPIFFLLGVQWLYQKKMLRLGRAIAVLTFLIIWVSGILGFIAPNFWGGILSGKFGLNFATLIVDTIGGVGSALLFVFSFLVFLVIRFNANLRFGNFLKSKPIQTDETSAIPDTPLPSNNYTHRNEFEEMQLDESIEECPIDELPPFEIRDELIIKDAEDAQDLEITNAPKSENESEPLLVLEPPTIETSANENESLSEKLVRQYGEYDPTIDLPHYKFPMPDLLSDYGASDIQINKDELEENKNRIVETLRNYNIDISKIKATVGPTVTLYEIIPAPGVRISKIKNLEDDIALSLAALGIRIIAPIPGKGTIGIEVPNQHPQVVSMLSVIKSDKFRDTRFELPVILGKTISNEDFIYDLSKMPHLLMAGATGMGKSVGLNAILVSLLYKKHPSQIKFVMVDPKKVELTLYGLIEKHFLAKLPGEEKAIITDTKKALNTLNSLCIEMDNRYALLENAAVRTIKEYNAKFVARKLNPNDGHRFLPYIILLIDEFADLIITAGKEVETPIARIAQLARAVGIHLIIATQRPSVNIITGTIKANFPARIAFKVTSKIDSRTILDSGGAEQLIGRGDMLFSSGSDLIRLQCPFVDTPEVERIAQFIGSQPGYAEPMKLPEYIGEEGDPDKTRLDINDRDELFEEAARIIVQHQQGSASLLQRRLNLGYNRAGRLIDQMEMMGIVGPNKGSKAREVLLPDLFSLEQFLKDKR
ncbi:MAG: DNA translocase FtsK [Candidatus Competibacteraceae bacterium]|nr:DNA translocase FtsK [Candidatus Competibacteraceae bacterium]